MLKANCQRLYDWSEKWLMKLNISKCKVLTVTHSKSPVVYKYGFEIDNLGFVELERVKSMNDLGVIIDSDLSFKEHIHHKIDKAYQMIGIISRNFKNIDKLTFNTLNIG